MCIRDRDKLYPRDVEVLYRDSNTVYVGSGLNEGDRVCVTEVPDLISGLPVDARPLTAEEASEELTDNTTSTSKP